MVQQITNLADVEAIEAAGIEAYDIAPNILELVQRAADRFGDKTAINGFRNGTVDEEPVSITYNELLAKMRQTANLLHDLGVGPTDVVTLMMPISIETNICLWGAEIAGIANPINSFLEVEHLAGILKAAGTKALIACHPDMSPDPWPKAMQLKEQLPELSAVIQVGGPDHGEDGIICWEQAIATQPSNHLVSGRDIAPNDIAAYFHTGGTTGVPKLARHTHFGQILQAWNITRFLENNPDAHGLVGVPMFHVGGTTVASLTAFTQGATMTLLGYEGFRNPETMRDTMRIAEKMGATQVGGVPAIWSGLLNFPTDDLDLSKLRYGIVGAAPLSVEIVNAVNDKYGIDLVEGWGMTETQGFACMNPLKGKIKIGSVGLRAPFTEIRIAVVDENKQVARECGVNEIGSVLVRGPQIVDGYVEASHNQDAWVEGDWLDTGDLGRLDEDGYLWLTGRAKDLIIRGGHNIDPVLIEDVLYQHDGVQLAAAIGRPDVRVGELPVAYVQMKPGVAFDPDDLMSFVKERVAERAANPVEIIETNEMPLTAVGKIFKPTLRLDIAERTFQRELESVLQDLDASVAVSVRSDMRHGAIAEIEISAASAELGLQAEAICAERMAPHAMRSEIKTRTE